MRRAAALDVNDGGASCGASSAACRLICTSSCPVGFSQPGVGVTANQRFGTPRPSSTFDARNVTSPIGSADGLHETPMLSPTFHAS